MLLREMSKYCRVSYRAVSVEAVGLGRSVMSFPDRSSFDKPILHNLSGTFFSLLEDTSRVLSRVQCIDVTMQKYENFASNPPPVTIVTLVQELLYIVTLTMIYIIIVNVYNI